MFNSDWPSMSMKPGATISPFASMVVRAVASGNRPIATMRPSRMATSPWYHGEPVPSMMRPLRNQVVISLRRCSDNNRRAGHTGKGDGTKESAPHGCLRPGRCAELSIGNRRPPMKRRVPGIAAGYGRAGCAACETHLKSANCRLIAHVRTQQDARGAPNRAHRYTGAACMYDPRP